MKAPHTHFLILLSGVAGLLAQDTAPAPPPFPEPSTVPPPVILDAIFIDAGTIGSALEVLEQQLPDPALLPNVILSDDARKSRVPVMRLYRIRPVDAIQLIANSARYQVEPISSIEPGMQGAIVAYRIFDPYLEVIPGAAPTNGPTPATTLLPPSPPISLPTPAEAFNQLGGAFLFANPNGPQPFDVMVSPPGLPAAGAGGVGMMTPNATVMKVYPLGITQITAKEFETLLRDMLRQAELDTLQDKTRLMFHEQSRILMANAPDQVHQIISQLLDALSRNQQADLLQRLPGPVVVP